MSAQESFAGALLGPLPVTEHAGAKLGVISGTDSRTARIERIVREHHPFVWRTVRRLGVRDADLDDVVQEVFLIAAKNVDAIESGRERGYLFRTSSYVAAHARRTAHRRREVVDEERLSAEIDGRPTPEQSAVTSETRARLQSILDTMSDDFRAVFVLHELEHMTMAEIAETLNVPPGTVASRLRRAREVFVSRATSGQREGNTP